MSLVGKVIGYAPKLWNYTQRLVKASPYIIFEDAAKAGVEAAAKTVKTDKMSFTRFFKNVFKDGLEGVEKSITNTKGIVGNSFFKASWKSIKEIPSVISASIKAKTATATGLGKIWAGIKGFGDGVGKKLPLIGNLLMIAFELPNIVKATKEKGIGQGITETVKAGIRLTAASIASAIGTTIGGPIGGIAGFFVGEWLASKVIGKSYSEKVAEEEQKNQEAIERVQRMQQEGTLPQDATTTTQPSFTGNQYNPYQSNPFSNYDSFANPYADDMYMKNINFSALC